MRPVAAATAAYRPAGTPRTRFAMRTTRRAVTPGVGAPGAGVRPGPGVGAVEARRTAIRQARLQALVVRTCSE
jgi:hypothetical protein